jgi:xylan 1,4-beta-xylosidase
MRNGSFFRPIWAPEIHYFKNTFWLTYSIPGCGNGILKSTTGKAEGPYVSALNPDVPLSKKIDGSLFIDEDGKVYSVAGNCEITPLKDDLSGPAGPGVVPVAANAKQTTDTTCRAQNLLMAIIKLL